MEGLLIFIVLGIVVYVVYESTPNAKYKKALKLIESDENLKVKEILESIYDKHPSAAATVAELKLNEFKKVLVNSVEGAIALLKTILNEEKRLPNISNKTLYYKVSNKARFELVSLQFDLAHKQNSIKKKIESVELNLIEINSIENSGVSEKYKNLKQKHIVELAKLYYQLGKQKEKKEKYLDAIQSYKKSIKLRKINNILTRIYICKLKLSDGSFYLDEIEQDVDNSSENYKNDLYYRYIIRLIKEENFLLANKLLEQKLCHKNDEVQLLKSYLNDCWKEQLLLLALEINSSLEKYIKKELNHQEEVELYNEIRKIIKIVEPIDPEMAKELYYNLPSLANRIVNYKIDKSEFDKVFEFIQDFPDFYLHNPFIKNLGLCSYSIVVTNKLEESNYQNVISAFITSVFSDKILVDSLTETSWDDDYSFTLIDSLGKVIIKGDENINHKQISSSNISIGATQRNLLNHFEEKLSFYSGAFVVKASAFFHKEKESIIKIIKRLKDEKDKENAFFNCVRPTPFFALTYGLNEKIVSYMKDMYLNLKEVDVISAEKHLDCATVYNRVKKGIVYDYSKALKIVSEIEHALLNKDDKKINNISKVKKNILFKFETITELFNNRVNNILEDLTEQNKEDGKIVKLLFSSIKAFKGNEFLHYLTISYSRSFCIHIVNNEKQNARFRALEILAECYYLDDKNTNVCKDFTTVILLCLSGIINYEISGNKIEKVFNILDKLSENASETFLNHSYDLRERRNTILSEVSTERRVMLTSHDLHSDLLLNEQDKNIKSCISYMDKLSHY